MSKIDSIYDSIWLEKQPIEKISRTCSLFEEIRQILEQQIFLEYGKLSEKEIKRKIAQKLYCTDSFTQALLKKVSKI